MFAENRIIKSPALAEAWLHAVVDAGGGPTEPRSPSESADCAEIVSQCARVGVAISESQAHAFWGAYCASLRAGWMAPLANCVGVLDDLASEIESGSCEVPHLRALKGTVPDPVGQPEIRDALADVLTHILQASRSDALGLFAQLTGEPLVDKAVQAAMAGDPRAFGHALLIPIDRFVEGLLSHAAPGKPEAHFLLRHAAFVERHFRAVIERMEGMQCCADKAGWLNRKLMRFYLVGERIVLNRDQQYTFHLPTRVFVTHDEIVLFFLAVRDLYYGRSDGFVEALSRLPRESE